MFIREYHQQETVSLRLSAQWNGRVRVNISRHCDLNVFYGTFLTINMVILVWILVFVD